MTSTILFADRIGPDFPKLPATNSATATTVGSSSIFLWAVWPSLAVYAAPAPTFQVLAIGMTIGFLVLAALRVGRGEPLLGMLPESRGLLIAGIVGILGTNSFNFLAITRISPAQASVIAYLWPILALALAGSLGLKVLHWRHYVAMILGFLGAVLVIDPFASISLDLLGIGYAFLAGLSFAGYTTYRLIDSRSSSDAVGVYSLVAALVCAGVHFGTEVSQTLSLTQIVAVIALGLAPMGLANAVWDYGVARGDARTLSILAYGTPLVATLLLVVLGLAEITTTLLSGAVLVVLGAAVGTWPSRQTG